MDVEEQGIVTPTWIEKAWRCLKMILSGIWNDPGESFLKGLVYLFYPFLLVGSKWKRVFLLSCVAVSVDALFLYIPIIDQRNKCLDSDKTLRNVALVLRSLTDLVFICHIIVLINDWMDETMWDDSNSDSNNTKALSWLALKIKPVQEAIAEKMPEWLSISIIVNFLAILPVPQMTIVVGYFKMGGSKHFLKHAIINVFILFQGSLRVFQIILSIKKMDEKVGKWVKCSFYILLYIIGSHVFASLWYFFSIQREISCWDQACRTIAECTTIYYCGRSTSLNSTFIDKLCPIKPPNATVFDFGMYLNILQSGNTGYTSFSRKFFYSFWWSLKNLSNFGTNLETSSNMWENCFAILICIIGLLLFLFLIGVVQTYIQIEAAEFMKIEESRRTRITKKKNDIEKWMLIHDIPEDERIDIISNFREEHLIKYIDKDVDTEFMYRCYEGEWYRTNPLVFVCVNALKKIPILEDTDEEDLKKAFCNHIRLNFPEFTVLEKDSYITKAGEDIKSMYLIIEGEIECNDDAEIRTARLGYKYLGEQLLDWALSSIKKQRNDSFPPAKFKKQSVPLPTSKVNVKCRTKVGAFKFPASKLINMVKELKILEQLLEEMAPPIKTGDSSNGKMTIGKWMSSHDLSDDVRIYLKSKLKRGFNMKTEVDTQTIHNYYERWNVLLDPLVFLCVKALKNVPILIHMDKQDLIMFRKYDYDGRIGRWQCGLPACTTEEKDNYITRAGQELNAMWLIIDGVITCKDAETTTTTSPTRRRLYDHVGEELLRWAVLNYKKVSFDDRDPLPVSSLDVKCLTKIGGFMFTVDDLIQTLWALDQLGQRDSKRKQRLEQLEALALSHDSKTDRRIKDWLLRIGFPEDLKAMIMSCPYKLVLLNMDPDVDVEFLFRILPENITSSIRRHVGMNAFKKVPMLQNMHEYVLEIICSHLKPAVYKKNSYIAKAGEPLGLMIFILRGTLRLTYTSTSNNAAIRGSSEIIESHDDKNYKMFGRGGFLGGQLLSWASPNNISYYSDHPMISKHDVKCETEVEALILQAEDLRTAVSKCGSQWNINHGMSSHHLVSYGRDRVTDGTSASASSSSTSPNNEQTIRLHQGHDMLLEQLILIRETLSTQGRKLDEMATFLAKLGYAGADLLHPPAP